MGKIIQNQFITKEEVDEIMSRVREEDFIYTEEENCFFNYWFTGVIDLPEENLLQKRYKENVRKKYDEQIKELEKGFRGKNVDF